MASGSRDGTLFDHGCGGPPHGDEVINTSALHPVWRKLPADLVEFVLKRVPFESLVRFRAVCKRFRFLITSPKFARECQRQQARKPVPVFVPTCILSDSCSLKVFNTKTNSWLTCLLPIFETRLYPLEVIASSGGLICFRSLDFGTFVVYNLLTGAFRLVELPTPNERKICPVRAFTSLVVDLEGGTFTLVVVTTSHNEAGRKTLLYDSTDGSWRSGAPLPDMKYFADEMISFDTVTSNGSIYGLLKSIHYAFPILLKYDVRSDKWSEISLADVVYRDNIEIVENRCEVVIVSAGIREGCRLKCMDFQLRRPKFLYRVRETTAGHGETLVVEDKVVFQALHKTEWINVVQYTRNGATFGLGDVICFTKHRGRDNLNRVLHFNCSNQKLSELPEYPIPFHWPKFQLVEPSLTVDL